MRIYILFGRRRDNSNFEALSIADEYKVDREPFFLTEELEKYGQSGKYSLLNIKTFDINKQDIPKFRIE